MIIYSFNKSWLNICYVSGINLDVGMYNKQNSHKSVLFMSTVLQWFHTAPNEIHTPHLADKGL